MPLLTTVTRASVLALVDLGIAARDARISAGATRDFTGFKKTRSECRRPMRSCLAMILAALLVAGCQRRESASGPDSTSPTPTTGSSPSWNQQREDVASGKTDSIDVEQIVDDSMIAGLRQLDSLRILRIERSEITAAGLSSLEGLPQLQHLQIRGRPLDDASLTCIGKLTELRVLNLPQLDATAEGFRQLAKLSNLELLRIGGKCIDDEWLALLVELPRLKFLHLIGPGITDAGLSHVGGLPKLQSFYLDDAAVSEAALESLLQSRPGLHLHLDQRHLDRDPQRNHE